MTDPLGRSQVIPYLIELSKFGHEFHLISFEKKSNHNEFHSLSALLMAHHIKWLPLIYHKYPPVISTIYDLWVMYRNTLKVISENKIDFIHSRSYPPSLVALTIKKKKKIPFIFDMRGFWADERVEGNLWPMTNPLFRLIYRFFKRKEKELLLHSDAVVSLTENAKQWMINEWSHTEVNVPVYVIPCCCDTNLFIKQTPEMKKASKYALQIPQDDFVLGYVGSIGTWYLLDEMMQFFKCLQELKPDSWFLFITNHEHELIRRKADEYQISNLKIVSATRNEVAELLNALDASVYFIKPSFSKKASSPVKQAELMAVGIPAVTNSGIGDTDLFFTDESAGILIHDFDRSQFMNAVEILLSGKFDPTVIRQISLKHFTLQHGAKLYAEIYNGLVNRINDDTSRHV